MILTTHALVGAAIGKNIGNPWIVIALSIIFHFFLDSFRHGEYVEVFDKETSIDNSGWKAALDVSLGAIIILAVIFFEHPYSKITNNIFLGSAFSLLPDFITLLYWKFRWKLLKKYYAFHSWVHKYPRYASERLWTFRNALNDIIISSITIIILFL